MVDNGLNVFSNKYWVHTCNIHNTTPHIVWHHIFLLIYLDKRTINLLTFRCNSIDNLYFMFTQYGSEQNTESPTFIFFFHSTWFWTKYGGANVYILFSLNMVLNKIRSRQRLYSFFTQHGSAQNTTSSKFPLANSLIQYPKSNYFTHLYSHM